MERRKLGFFFFNLMLCESLGQTSYPQSVSVFLYTKFAVSIVQHFFRRIEFINCTYLKQRNK